MHYREPFGQLVGEPPVPTGTAGDPRPGKEVGLEPETKPAVQARPSPAASRQPVLEAYVTLPNHGLGEPE